MVGSAPLAAQGTYSPTGDQTETLARIDRNMARILTWVKLLVVVVIVLIILNAVLFVP